MPKISKADKTARFFAALDTGASRLQALSIAAFQFKTPNAGKCLAQRLIRDRQKTLGIDALPPELQAIWNGLEQRERDYWAEWTPEDRRDSLEYLLWWNNLSDEERQERQDFKAAWYTLNGPEQNALYPGLKRLETSNEAIFQHVGLAALPLCPKCGRVEGSYGHSNCSRSPQAVSGVV